MRGLVERCARAACRSGGRACSLMTKHPELLWRNVQWTRGRAASRSSSASTTCSRRRSISEPGRAAASRARRRSACGSSTGPLPFRSARICARRAAPTTSRRGSRSRTARSATCRGRRASRAGSPTRRARARRARCRSSRGASSSSRRYHATRALLEVYLGKNAARRVLAGAFRRGGGELIDAAIWFCDLRDFTAMSDRAPAAGGRADARRVLRSRRRRGDGARRRGAQVHRRRRPGDLPGRRPTRRRVPQARSPPREDALAGARASSTRERASAASARSRSAWRCTCGQVMYGNIGARDRLDFTVISSAVNEACRLEALCKPLGTPLALSEAFARASARRASSTWASTRSRACARRCTSSRSRTLITMIGACAPGSP